MTLMTSMTLTSLALAQGRGEGN